MIAPRNYLKYILKVLNAGTAASKFGYMAAFPGHRQRSSSPGPGWRFPPLVCVYYQSKEVRCPEDGDSLVLGRFRMSRRRRACRYK